MCSVYGEKDFFFQEKKDYFLQSTFMGNENKKSGGVCFLVMINIL